MITRSSFCCVLLVAAVGLWPSQGRLSAADQAKQKQSEPAKEADPLDEQLLRGLDNELLEGLPADSAPAEQGGAADSSSEETSAGSDTDRLGQIGRRMRSAEEHIEQQKSPQRTLELQQQIVADLSKLIDQLEKQCQAECASSGACKGGSPGQKSGDKPGQKNQQPSQTASGKTPASQPARNSTAEIRKQHAQRPDMGKMHDLMRDLWGQLPERARNEMLQSPKPEQFLPKYEILLENYYKRLAEEQNRRP